MPDAAWAVSVHPPSLSREKGQPPVLTSSNPLSTLHRRFAYARLSQSCLPESRSGFPQRSPPWLLTTAACGGLRPAPDCRPRRAHLHLSYSCTCRLDRHARDTRPKADMECAVQDDSLINYLISWSARARIDCGTVRPSVFAVLRLITRSNFAGCTTGRSAGFSPLRMRPA